MSIAPARPSRRDRAARRQLREDREEDDVVDAEHDLSTVSVNSNGLSVGRWPWRDARAAQAHSYPVPGRIIRRRGFRPAGEPQGNFMHVHARIRLIPGWLAI